MDAIGNRVTEQRQGPTPSALLPLSRAYSYGNDDSILSDSIWNFTNDNSGNRTAETNGIKTASYTFSADNLLNSWVDTSGTISNYAYDPLGHRISKVIGANSNKYVLDISNSLSQILQITDAGGVVKSNYVYGLGLLESIDAANNPLYYHLDAQHNTTALTDQAGVIKDTYTYDPFGAMLRHAGTTIQPFTFLGEYGVVQETSSIYYARARYYDAANGRFISKDDYPSDLNNPQTINRYVYGVNNPVSLFDFTGLWPNLGTLGQSAIDFGKSSFYFGLGIAHASLSAVQIVGEDNYDATSSFYSSLQDFNKSSYYSVGVIGNLYNGLTDKGVIPQNWYQGAFDNFNNTGVGKALENTNTAYSIYSLGKNISNVFNGKYELPSSKFIDIIGKNNPLYGFNNMSKLISLDLINLYGDWIDKPKGLIEMIKSSFNVFKNSSFTSTLTKCKN